MALDSELEQAGYILPTGSSHISEGDDAIRQNASASYEQVRNLRVELKDEINSSATRIKKYIEDRYAQKQDEDETLIQFTGGSLDIGQPENGRIIGVQTHGIGTVAGTDVLPGEVWVFVGFNDYWMPYKAGGGSGASGQNIIARPNISVKNVTENSATIEWPTAAGAVSYEARQDGGVPYAVSSPLVISGLQPASSFTVSVRSVSESGEKSAWAEKKFSTLEPSPVPARWTLGTFGDSANTVISSTKSQDDTVTGNNTSYAKFARSVQYVPANSEFGFFEFTIPSHTNTNFSVALTDYSSTNINQYAIGIQINTDGSLSAKGGVYAGGVKINGGLLSNGKTFRLKKSKDGSVAIQQLQNGNFVNIASLVNGKVGKNLYLAVGGSSAGESYRVESISMAA